jgi:hypothetical protein
MAHHPRRSSVLGVVLAIGSVVAGVVPAFAMLPRPNSAPNTVKAAGDPPIPVEKVDSAPPIVKKARAPLVVRKSRGAAPAVRKARVVTPKKPTATSVGYDVSYPQCSSSLPKSPPFAIVGVTGGRAYATNPCLAAEYAWAQTATSTTYPRISFYANTGNPGPVLSKAWPTGQIAPRACDGTWSEGCSYDYGWNAAADAFAKASAVAGASVSRAAYWWLDVETGNSWATASDSADWAALNTNDLQGAAAYLASQGVGQIGFYSTGFQWGQITGLTASTSPAYFPVSYVNWVPGATTLSGAQARCSSAYSFTGARVQLTQYIANNLDDDYRCY